MARSPRDLLAAVCFHAAVAATPSLGRAATSEQSPAPPLDAQPVPKHQVVWVHLELPAGVRFERSTPGGPWETACAAPCDEALESNGIYYRVVGGPVGPMGFALAASPGYRETVVVRPPVPGLLVLGVGIGTVGGLGLLGGAFLLFANELATGLFSDGPNDGNEEGKFYGPVLAVMGVGALLLSGGILLGKEYGSARVSQVVEPGQQGAQASRSWMPSWTQAPLEGRTGSLSSTIPIVVGRF